MSVDKKNNRAKEMKQEEVQKKIKERNSSINRNDFSPLLTHILGDRKNNRRRTWRHIGRLYPIVLINRQTLCFQLPALMSQRKIKKTL